MTKPLPKSLHTVTVLVRVATLLRGAKFPPLTAPEAVDAALDILGYDPENDPYGLAAAAAKQMDKVNENGDRTDCFGITHHAN